MNAQEGFFKRMEGALNAAVRKFKGLPAEPEAPTTGQKTGATIGKAIAGVRKGAEQAVEKTTGFFTDVYQSAKQAYEEQYPPKK